MKILLVDDDRLSRTVLAKMLRLHGFECEVFADPLEALDHFFRRPDFDAVISDIRMPQMNGVEMAGILRRSKPDLPIILITAFSEREPLSYLPDIQVQALYKKPIDIQLLVGRLRALEKEPQLKEEGSGPARA